MKKTTRLATGISLILCGLAGNLHAQVWRADQGDGTYRNPVLFADYPDPDIIRVGEDFYFISTTFSNVPGVTILQSKDLVNWQIAAHVVDRLDGDARYDLIGGDRYRQGYYAASLRFHDSKFYIAVTPVGQKTRLYRASDIKGPWTYTELDREAFDPALFFDTDGKGYIATSIGSDGTLTLLSLNADYTAIIDAREVYYNKGAEGSKIVRRGDYYYLFNAIPSKLALTVSRAHNLNGPWETRSQIDDKSGGHQGAIVDLPDGGWAGFVMVDAGPIGRMTNISPIFWQDDWPIWGTPQAPGRVPDRAIKPVQGYDFAEPPTSDDFSSRMLGQQWQWNHNPDDSRWSLSSRPGFLRLEATQATGIWSARNTLTQKGQGPGARAVVRIDAAGIRPGDTCGFGTFGKISAQLAVVGGGGNARTLRMQVTDATAEGPSTQIRVASIPLAAKQLLLRTDMDFVKNVGRVGYSLDGRKWTDVGGDFPLIYDWRTGTFQGQQFALSCYNPAPNGGHLDVDDFTLVPIAAATQE